LKPVENGLASPEADGRSGKIHQAAPSRWFVVVDLLGMIA
jgi:hypothetical protein